MCRPGGSGSCRPGPLELRHGHGGVLALEPAARVPFQERRSRVVLAEHNVDTWLFRDPVKIDSLEPLESDEATPPQPGRPELIR
jgi:hypothetical protein